MAELKKDGIRAMMSESVERETVKGMSQRRLDVAENEAPEREFDHFSIVPFKAICGADSVGQTTSQAPERVKCAICWRYWKEWDSSRDLAAPDAAQLPTGESILREYVEHELDDHYDGPSAETELVIPHPPTDLIERIDDALRLARRADAVRQAPRKTCVWFLDDATDSSLWETDCGQAFQFNDGGPEENHFRFCYYCGNPLEALRRTESDEVDEAAALRAEGEKE